MLNREELNRIYRQAYLPEHLPAYVEAISGAQAHLIGNYLCFTRKTHLIFIGYPLGVNSGDAPRAYASACRRFEPSTVALIAPDIWLPPDEVQMEPHDSYYRYRLPVETMAPKVANMIRRAEQELSAGPGKLGKEHRRLIKAFLRRHRLAPEQVQVFKHVERYLAQSSTAHLLEARKQDVLVAFSVVDTGAADYAFYLFNFRSQMENVPGASDLLFKAMLELAQSESKKAVNLGLGVHSGIRRFKEKWGGVPFLPYRAAWVDRKGSDFGQLAHKL